MAGHFSGQRVVITGASSGIGAEMARQMASQGARLVLAARREPELKAVAEECRQLGGAATTVVTDVTVRSQCRALMESSVAALGGIDVLVNNAGISMREEFEHIANLDIFEQLMRVNYLGSVHCTHYALPQLLESRGSIVVVSSLAGKTGVPGLTGYAASKYALHGFFESLRIELLDSGVTVTMACPGLVKTGLIRYGGEQGTIRSGMSVETCARIIVRAAGKRKREVIMTPLAKAGQFIKPFLPSLIDRIARRKVRPT
ncbi:MAG: SDR family oxidoreductase [Candidatus Marinimicrobia bacterium]|nr:SDR family oxidoreductase [Candidatus Neomarinimicrobiota bacterium]